MALTAAAAMVRTAEALETARWEAEEAGLVAPAVAVADVEARVAVKAVREMWVARVVASAGLVEAT